MTSQDLDLQKQIEDYMTQHGGLSNLWYVGIAGDPKDRLENGHGVRENDAWIRGHATAAGAARAIEQYFLDRGTDGGPGGGDERSSGVYAYKKASHTNP